MTKRKIEHGPRTFFLPLMPYLAAHVARSAEEVRYYLNGVFVDVRGEDNQQEIRLIATDGHMLNHYEINTDGLAWVGRECYTQADSHGGGFILSFDVMEKAIKAKSAAPKWIHGDIDSGVLQVFDGPGDEFGEARRLGVCEFSRIDGTFPDWRRVVPSASGEVQEFGVGTANMDKLIKTARILDCKGFTWEFGSKHDPARVTNATHRGFYSVVMPFRV